MIDNKLQSYYTTNHHILRYMVQMIEPKDTDTIFEPCGGCGDFIDALLSYNSLLKIETCDIDETAVSCMQQKYANNGNINIRQTDTLIDPQLDMYSMVGYYDKIIGNPPYGAWQEINRRLDLKRKYGGFYAKETYSLFLLRCVSLLKEEGLLSFIIPDTFLFLHNHNQLRNYLLTNTLIREILIFPSKYFPGVSFGYSNLSIITVQRTHDISKALNNTISIFNKFNNETEISIDPNKKKGLNRIDLTQEEVYETQHHCFILDNGEYSKVIREPSLTLGDIADCVTGIYTGDNKRFIFAKDLSTKGAKNYRAVETVLIDYECNSLSGTQEPMRYVPLIKGNPKNSYFRGEAEWFIDWSASAIKHYTTDTKARFQNSKYYFKTGVALPMIKSSQIKATLFEKAVFDQSIVGVFPKQESDLFYILGLLNSSIFNRLLHLVNPTANNSAKYIRKTPVPRLNKTQKTEIANLVQKRLSCLEPDALDKDIDEVFENLYMLSGAAV